MSGIIGSLEEDFHVVDEADGNVCMWRACGSSFISIKQISRFILTSGLNYVSHFKGLLTNGKATSCKATKWTPTILQCHSGKIQGAGSID